MKLESTCFHAQYSESRVYRDFANGFLVAEVLSKYFPDDVQMHSFENVTSAERKKSNWHLLKKFFKVTHTMPGGQALVCNQQISGL